MIKSTVRRINEYAGVFNVNCCLAIYKANEMKLAYLFVYRTPKYEYIKTWKLIDNK